MDAHTRTAPGADDETLVGRLGRTLALTDPAPPDLQRTACELLVWRTVDAELADLLRAGLAHPPAAAD
jgi:hypothetical protein